LNQHERIHHYHSKAVGWLELRVADTGLRSISFISKPAVQQSSEKDPLTARVIKELDDYFAGEAKSFTVPLDPLEGTCFQHKVWEQLLQIPYGQVRSYGDVAKAVGNPRGARAAGPCPQKELYPYRNPVPPCHQIKWPYRGLRFRTSYQESPTGIGRCEGWLDTLCNHSLTRGKRKVRALKGRTKNSHGCEPVEPEMLQISDPEGVNRTLQFLTRRGRRLQGPFETGCALFRGLPPTATVGMPRSGHR
jgi:methylated-DNA-[protein]-cysteine S-methyltransferase